MLKGQYPCSLEGSSRFHSRGRALLLSIAAITASVCLYMYSPGAVSLVGLLAEPEQRCELSDALSGLWPSDLLKKHKKSDPFKWTSCEGVADKRFKCGRLTVPLDYTNKSDKRTAEIATVLFQVGKKKSKHTIILNPGGPGGSGTASAYYNGERISVNKTDSTVDVLGFDPRGVNISTPSISCFPYDADRDRYSLLRSLPRETSKDPTEHLMLADAMNEAIMEACLAQYGDIPRFVSTAFVARDVDSIREALGEDELWAYMISYGTGIGQTYAQMFPDKVGRVLLDGLEFQDDGRRLGGFGWTALDNATDAWIDGVLGECVNAGPSRCALAVPPGKSKKPVTLKSLEKRMSSLLEKVKARPIPGISEQSGPGIVSYGPLIDLIYAALYNANSWPSLAEALAQLEQGNATLTLTKLEAGFEFDPTLGGSPSGGRVVKHPRSRHAKHTQHSLSSLAVPTPAPPSSDELGSLVICGDSYDAPPQPLEWWVELQANMTKKAFISGNSRFYDVFGCRHFKWEMAEVYRGGFQHRLKNPLLLIGETYDPATPIRNGRRLYHAMGTDNARLIVHDGYGHSSRDTSACTEKYVRDFFVHGKVPALDDRNDRGEIHCKADGKPYPEEEKRVFGVRDWHALRKEARVA